MWILRRHHECLNHEEKAKVDLLFKHSVKLKQAYQYALKLTQIYNTHCTKKSAMAKIKRWMTSVIKKKVQCFYTFVKTLAKYKTFIANYFKRRKTSGFVEGLNNKIKVVTRRCFGVTKVKTLFQRIYLDLRGYECYGL